MRFALVNPAWSFEGSIYFGCREPHLPLEFGYSQALLEQSGHDVMLVDAQMEGLTHQQVREAVRAFEPDYTVITTAPSYLFWRCAPPELRVPQDAALALRGVGGVLVAVGPHCSTTPRPALRKLGVDMVLMGECEDQLSKLAGDWTQLDGIAYRHDLSIRVQGRPHETDMSLLPALQWPESYLRHHRHHHHRFDGQPAGPGAEMETSRGCPYHCTFCAKDNFRDRYRRRPLTVILEELDGLLSAGVEYVYFIDEIFLPQRDVLSALAQRKVKIGIQTRIDLWSEEDLDLLASAGCVSIEAGVESISEEGRARLNKRCKMSTQDLADRLLYAKRDIPFVQANLLKMEGDSEAEIGRFREYVVSRGVWANEPVPLYPYPGSPEYTRRWGAPDDLAWERAHEAYLTGNDEFSDIQERRPQSLVQLESHG